MMKINRNRDTDEMTDIISAYRLPTLIVIIGIVMAILGFQMALNYDIRQSERSFSEFADQVYRKIDSGVRRHELQISSLGNIIGQIRGFSNIEFKDIANSFTVESSFSDISLYTFSPKSGIEEIYTNPDTDKATAAQLSAITPAVIKAMETNKIYLSPSVEYTIGHNSFKAMIFAIPILKKYRENVFLVSVLNLDKFFTEMFREDEDKINLRIFRIEGDNKALVYEKFAKSGQAFFSAIGDRQYEGMHVLRQRFFDDFSWEVHIFATPGSFMASVGLFPWITLLSVLSLTILLGYMAFRITVENVRIRHIVEQQTHSLRSYNQELEQRNKDLDDFAYIASHDLKEPLRGIYNYSEFLIEDHSKDLSEDGKNKLYTIRKLSRRMENLIESLLEYSRLSRQDVNFETVDLNEALEIAVDSLDIFIKDNNAKIDVKSPLPQVVAHGKTIPEVFRNLITNALKYNTSKEKLVTISWKDEADGWVSVKVTDNGIGIAPEHQAMIFKIFKRLHGRDDYGGGTGSGLTIVQKIIERHGGKVSVTSDGRDGTSFTFLLKKSLNNTI